MRRAALAFFALVPAAAAAEEPVRTCPRHGPGFVQIPGTSTCIRIAGRVVSEHTTVSGGRRFRREDISGFGASGRVSADVRTDTAYGPLRTFVRMKVSDGPATR